MEINKTISFRNGAIELHRVSHLLTDRYLPKCNCVLVCFKTLKMQIGANCFLAYEARDLHIFPFFCSPGMTAFLQIHFR